MNVFSSLSHIFTQRELCDFSCFSSRQHVVWTRASKAQKNKNEKLKSDEIGTSMMWSLFRASGILCCWKRSFCFRCSGAGSGSWAEMLGLRKGTRTACESDGFWTWLLRQLGWMQMDDINPDEHKRRNKTCVWMCLKTMVEYIYFWAMPTGVQADPLAKRSDRIKKMIEFQSQGATMNQTNSPNSVATCWYITHSDSNNNNTHIYSNYILVLASMYWLITLSLPVFASRVLAILSARLKKEPLDPINSMPTSLQHRL